MYVAGEGSFTICKQSKVRRADAANRQRGVTRNDVGTTGLGPDRGRKVARRAGMPAWGSLSHNMYFEMADRRFCIAFACGQFGELRSAIFFWRFDNQRQRYVKDANAVAFLQHAPSILDPVRTILESN